jgi:hypothetical protein
MRELLLVSEMTLRMEASEERVCATKSAAFVMDTLATREN